VNLWIGEVQQLAFSFRKIHSDFIDRLKLGCAVVYANVFVCDDNRISKLVKLQSAGLISKINKDIRMLYAKQAKREF
jgi:hypothetical protein